MRTIVYIVRFAWDLTRVLAAGFRDDYRAAKRGLLDDVRTVTKGTPD